jgi:hypothetical protein
MIPIYHFPMPRHPFIASLIRMSPIIYYPTVNMPSINDILSVLGLHYKRVRNLCHLWANAV